MVRDVYYLSKVLSGTFYDILTDIYVSYNDNTSEKSKNKIYERLYRSLEDLKFNKYIKGWKVYPETMFVFDEKLIVIEIIPIEAVSWVEITLFKNGSIRIEDKTIF